MDKRYDVSISQFALLKVAHFFCMFGGRIKYTLCNCHSFHHMVTQCCHSIGKQYTEHMAIRRDIDSSDIYCQSKALCIYV